MYDLLHYYLLPRHWRLIWHHHLGLAAHLLLRHHILLLRHLLLLHHLLLMHHILLLCHLLLLHHLLIWYQVLLLRHDVLELWCLCVGLAYQRLCFHRDWIPYLMVLVVRFAVHM